ncbi:hypothetical protein [Actinoplanes palleronii]|uniref:Uncharacterized protein n=1 Tax=Actinoplanes palleronii TaxID=113570 RepID=A0ABQ4B423_9ACTN|nr:hypothetical protein [Actinoplanes palleronii]GIE65408.1 hypothetical protein Apa02nite_015160 [Actinoplanes palleronii]
MLVTYKPEDGEPKTWEWIPGRVRISECAIAEKVFGKSWEVLVAEVQQGSAQARRVLLWHLQRREHPLLRFEDAPDFYADELLIEYDASELRAMRDGVAKSSGGMSVAEREMALAALDTEIAVAEARASLAAITSELPSGKAASSSD